MPTPAEIILSKVPLPTHLDSAEIRSRVAREIRERALFSARMASMQYLKSLQRVLAAYADGQLNAADARLRLMGVLDSLGLSEGSNALTDPGSAVARIDSQSPAILEQWPAWRLTRFGSRRIPREDWLRRWQAAGEAVGWQGAHRRLLVALKSSPIWEALGRGAGGFRDTLGNPYPPFAYGSGMDWEDVSAEETERLGLDPTSAHPQRASLAPDERDILEAMGRTGLSAKDFAL